MAPRSTQATIITPPDVMATDEGPTLAAGALDSPTMKVAGFVAVAVSMGPPDFQLLMLYWNADESRWSLEEPGRSLYDDEPKASPLIAAIAERLTERANAHLLSLARYDLQFHAERVALDAFFVEADRVAAALRNGTVIPGVNAVPDAFGR